MISNCHSEPLRVCTSFAKIDLKLIASSACNTHARSILQHAINSNDMNNLTYNSQIHSAQSSIYKHTATSSLHYWSLEFCFQFNSGTSKTSCTLKQQ